MRKYILLLWVALLAGSCNNKIDFGPDEGVSYRNHQNVPMGYTDDSDWTLDGKWNKQEVKLFADDLKVNVNSQPAGDVFDLGFFPNPVEAGGQATLLYRTALTNARLHLVFVDKKYKVLNRLDLPAAVGGRYGSQLLLDLPTSKFADKALYRLYYVFYNSDNTLYYKGHGDFKVGM